jgi:heme-degrading monooxygenase HmoA
VLQDYEGYLRHRLVEGLDDPGHLIVVSEWASREMADRVREEYAGHENARRADALALAARKRTVGRAVERSRL